MCLADRTCGRAPHTWFAQASDTSPLAHSLFLKWALRRHATSSQCLHRSRLVHSILFKVPLPYFFRLCQESLCPVAFIPLDTKLLHRGQFPTHPLATAHSLQYNPIPSSCPRVTHHPWMSTPEARAAGLLESHRPARALQEPRVSKNTKTTLATTLILESVPASNGPKLSRRSLAHTLPTYLDRPRARRRCTMRYQPLAAGLPCTTTPSIRIEIPFIVLFSTVTLSRYPPWALDWI